jgi:hypothetical protein
MTPEQIISQLKKWHIKFKEYRDWETHNRNHKGPWGPVNGFMWHHTGSDDDDQRELLYNGYGDLPGPLCQFGIAQDGTVWLIGWGRANHAGLGDDDVLEAVINETETPVDDEANTDGNRHFYGAEFWYSGNHPMSAAQYTSGVKLSCAILDWHKWDEESVIFHGMWQPGKWDPGMKANTMMDINPVRKSIDEALKKGPNVGMPTHPLPLPEVYKDVWETDAMDKAKTSTSNPENTLWTPETMLRYAAEQAAQANQKADQILKLLGNLE